MEEQRAHSSAENLLHIHSPTCSNQLPCKLKASFFSSPCVVALVPPPDGANAIPRLMLEEVIRGQAGEDPCPFPAMWKKKAQPTQKVGGGSAHLCNTVCSYLGLH